MEFRVLQWIQANMRCRFLDALMPLVSAMGNGGVVWLLAAAAMTCSRTYRRFGLLLAAGLIIGVLIGNVCMKNLVARSRPCWREPSVRLLISNPRDYSFPSGHTLSSTIAAVIITSANRKFGYAAIPLASAISFSRLYLYVHFPSDVLGASCLGLVLASVVLHFGLKL